MKNPLVKRLPRELRTEIGKYLVIFLLLAGTIGFVSGFLVADGSMLKAYNESFEKYNIENGNFRLTREANKAQKKSIESFGITLYENFYLEEELVNDSTLRIFRNRDQVNQVCLMEGEFPGNRGEIAIDRMYAVNNEIRIGDVLEGSDHTWKVTGYVALSDYSCLFSDNNDMMFDSVKFGVAIVNDEEFAQFDEELLKYDYAWKYDTEPADEHAEKEMSDELVKAIGKEIEMETFIPRYQNQAICFTGEDMGSDRAMMIALLYIIIAIMAFVFAVTVSNTIGKEANVIGTLRASGYTTGELIRHYMTMPMLITAVGALTGNVLGYTVFKNVCVGMYYGSYSLPTYVTIWSADAFLLTTVVPFFMMVIINFGILHRKLKLSPLKFLRRDISGKRQRRAFPLSVHIPFFSRFRLRIIFQNLGNYGILFVGILFANLLLMFGMLFPSILSHYQEEIGKNLLSNYQYMLTMPIGTVDEERKLESLLRMMYYQYEVETENEDAEKFSAYALDTLGTEAKSEEILLYGIEQESRYIPLDVSGGQVYVSSAYAEKYGVAQGDTVVLKESYEDTEYEFEVTGIYDYVGALALFMSRETLNHTFDLDETYYGGYFSDTEITDIDKSYIGSVIDLQALTKVSRQLSVSMGNMMTLVDGFAIVIFMILIYLLSKIIIEKNAQSISMAKILGYSDWEISRLYIISTSMVVVVFLLVSLPVEEKAMEFLFREIMMESITGWITFYIDPVIYVKMFFIGILTYAAVAVLEYRKIQKVPMDAALKNVE